MEHKPAGRRAFLGRALPLLGAALAALSGSTGTEAEEEKPAASERRRERTKPLRAAPFTQKRGG